MAIYQWVGGHTGYTGANSGYSATGGGTAGTSPRWTSVIDGTTSDSGDFVFGPHFWGNLNNWKKAVSVTGYFGFYNYVSTTTLPKGGDTVWFSGGYSGPSGQFVNTYSISCKYGGMSGDGITASGSTGWAGGYTAGSDAHGNISIVVRESFRPIGTAFGLNTGEIGVGANAYGNFETFRPLKVRANQISVSDTSLATLTGGAKIAINNIGADAYLSMASAVRQPRGGVVFITGNVGYIHQTCGSVYTTDIANTNGGYWEIRGVPTRFSASPTTAIETYSLHDCDRVVEGGYIWGNYGSQANIYIGGYSGGAPITLGSLNDGSSPTFTILNVGGFSTTGNNGTPNIKLATCEIKSLECYNGNISVSELLTKSDYPIIRDGFMRGGTLNMEHPEDPTWQNFLLGYNANDNGLRIDNANVVVRAYMGASLKTGTAESPGLT
jgi:hypothetical protein